MDKSTIYIIYEGETLKKKLSIPENKWLYKYFLKSF